MKVEEIESMLKDNKFDLNDIQILLDELAYNYDMIEELDEEVAQYKEDTNEYAKMYNEFNRDLPGYAIEIRNLESAIEKLDEKQQRLGGRISKKDVEKRNDYEQQIQDLKEKYEFSKSNRIASREGYNESKVKYDELLSYFSNLSTHVKEIEYEQKFTRKDINAIMKHFNIDNCYDDLKEE